MTKDKATDDRKENNSGVGNEAGNDMANDTGNDTNFNNDADKAIGNNAGNDIGNDASKDTYEGKETDESKDTKEGKDTDKKKDTDKSKNNSQEVRNRLYVTVPFDDETKKTILGIQYRLMAYGGGKFLSPDQLFLTLAYIRNQPAKAIAKIQEAMSQLVLTPCTLTFQKIKLFNLRDEDGIEVTEEGSLPLAVETWWLIVENIPELQNLYADLRSLLGKEGIFIKRRFVPHVTLARRTRIGNIDVSPLMTGPFTGDVDKVHLLQYQPTEAGASFKILY